MCLFKDLSSIYRVYPQKCTYLCRPVEGSNGPCLVVRVHLNSLTLVYFFISGGEKVMCPKNNWLEQNNSGNKFSETSVKFEKLKSEHNPGMQESGTHLIEERDAYTF